VLAQILLIGSLFAPSVSSEGAQSSVATIPQKYKIEGRIFIPPVVVSTFFSRVLVDGGVYQATVRADNSFTVYGVPAGSHVVEVFNPELLFIPVRVDISAKSKGKIKAVYFEEPTKNVPYPLMMEAAAVATYFEKREPLSLMGILRQPYILMTIVVPLGLILLFKVIDPKKMEEMANEASGDSPPAIKKDESQELLKLIWESRTS